MTDSTKSVGIVIRTNTGWTSGQYYIEQILIALIRSNQCSITILYDELQKPKWSVPELQSEALTYRNLTPKYSTIERLLNIFGRILIGRNLVEKRITKDEFDLIFPLSRLGEYPFQLANHVAYWIPDFQDNHHPENFSKDENNKRKIERTAIASSTDLVVLSSNDALNDFRRFYPDQKCRAFVLPFRVHHDQARYQDKIILEKYGVEAGEYLICPNQFWKHKNHLVLVEAVHLFKQIHPDEEISLLFSGKESGFANEGAAEAAKNRSEMLGLGDAVRFLGFIDRSDLLTLMRFSAAVLQPSLFEGWNTSIEDAHALGCPVLASNIPVHQEQMEGTDQLVDSASPDAWAKAMHRAIQKEFVAMTDYAKKQKEFSNQLLELINLASQ